MKESTAYHFGRASGRPRDADLEARIDALLATAATLFLEHGYDKTSLRTIAREAHVAVRTIYVKFGGKTGLFKAVIELARTRYDVMPDMMSDNRAIDHILEEFGLGLLQLLSTPQVVRMQRMIIAVARTHPEIALTFDRAGRGQVLGTLERFFARPEIAVQFRTDVTHEQLALHLYNCLLGDQYARLMFEPQVRSSKERLRRDVEQALAFFYKTVRRNPEPGIPSAS